MFQPDSRNFIQTNKPSWLPKDCLLKVFFSPKNQVHLSMERGAKKPGRTPSWGLVRYTEKWTALKCCWDVGILNHAVTLYPLYQNCIFNFMIIINKTEKAAFFFIFWVILMWASNHYPPALQFLFPTFTFQLISDILVLWLPSQLFSFYFQHFRKWIVFEARTGFYIEGCYLL